MDKIKPKKSLGQNFLIDNNIAIKIVKSSNLKEDDVVIEIGAGTGALTKYLLQEKIQLHSIEIDNNAINILHKNFPLEKYSNFHLHHGDVRDFKIYSLVINDEIVKGRKLSLQQMQESAPCEDMIDSRLRGNDIQYGNDINLINNKIKVIGNIPYNISSDIFFWLFEQAEFIEKAVLMVQKDVALRLTAKPRTKAYGILTAALGLVGHAKILFDVAPTCFYPKPDVISSIVEFSFSNQKIQLHEFKSVQKIIKAAFGNRRKTLRNSLSSYLTNIALIDLDKFIIFVKSIGFDFFSRRAEELTSEDFVTLKQLIEEFKFISK